jgi:hypothetical protein
MEGGDGCRDSNSEDDDGRNLMSIYGAFSALRNWITLSRFFHTDIAIFTAVIQRPLVTEVWKFTQRRGRA